MAAFPYSFSSLRETRLHLGVCGSVSAYKAVELMRLLQKLGIQVSVTLTEAGARFVSPLTFEALGAAPVYTRMFGQDEGVMFGHLLPGQTAHAFLIAPCTADALARIAAGLANEILCAQALAFDGPVVLAPAMNPRMWNNPATQANIAILEQRGHVIVKPAAGTMACGDNGEGKLADLGELALAAVKALVPQDMLGKNILLTVGPTREPWDAARVWTNLSTGRMGACLAQAACLRGASVYAIAGPGVPDLPEAVSRHDVETAKEMYEAANDFWPQAQYGIFTAAVADYSPVPYPGGKFKKKTGEGLKIQFVQNRDILATLAANARPEQRVLGFAAESDHLEEQCRDKRSRKNAHLLAGNLIGPRDSGFAAETNRMFVCDHLGREEHWPVMPKADVAWRLLDWLCTL